MKKSDLKTGMLVELNTGDIGLIVNDTIIFNNDTYCYLREKDDNLKSNTHTKYDIKRVSNILMGYKLLPSEFTAAVITDNLLWTRE